MKRTESARARILDAAAKLFQTSGVGATSIRAIIQAADVNLNAIHYHFGSKEALVKALFESVMTAINRERSELLDRAEGQTLDVRTLLRAVYWPLVRRAAASPRSTQVRGLMIVNQLRHDPSPAAVRILEEHEADFAPRFERLLQTATKLNADQLRPAIQFSNAAAWGLATQSALLGDVVGVDQRKARIATLFDAFLQFSAAGFDALHSSAPASGRGAKPMARD